MYHAINEYQLRLDVQRFFWPVCYISYVILFTWVLYFASWGVMSCLKILKLSMSPGYSKWHHKTALIHNNRFFASVNQLCIDCFIPDFLREQSNGIRVVVNRRLSMLAVMFILLLSQTSVCYPLMKNLCSANLHKRS